jgi:lysozyme
MSAGPDLIDISHFQGTVDFAKIKAAGIKGVWAKATDGGTMIDPRFAANRATAHSLGVPFGAYHFARPNRNTAQAEAAHFLTQIGHPTKGDLRAALDIEANCDNMTTVQVVAWIDDFLVAVQAAGWKTISYSYASFAAAHGFARHPSFRWIARYLPTPPSVPAGAATPLVWQYTDHAIVPGIGAACDGDRLMPGVTIDMLAAT